MKFRHVSWILSKDAQPLRAYSGGLRLSKPKLEFMSKFLFFQRKSFNISSDSMQDICLTHVFFKNPIDLKIYSIPALEFQFFDKIKNEIMGIRLACEGSLKDRFLPNSQEGIYDILRTKKLYIELIKLYFPSKIKNNKLSPIEESDINSFLNELDDEFKQWDQSAHEKLGKI